MANKRWVPAAQDIKQITTIAVTGTWAADDTATVTCNNKSVTVTVGTDTATTAIADIIARAINAVDATTNLRGDETRNIGGYSLGEFRDMVATVEDGSSTVTLTSFQGGIDFTVTASESTAGSGALGSPAESQSATGKNWFNNADNWGGSLPSNDDHIFFDHGSINCDNGLNTSSSITGLSLTRENGYRGNIGRGPINKTHGQGYWYEEYRDEQLRLPATASTSDQVITVGSSESALTPLGETRLDLYTTSNSSLTVVTNDSPPRSVVDGPSVTIVGGKSGSFSAEGGSTQLGGTVSDTATELSVTSVANDAYVHIKDTCTTIAVLAGVNVYGGTLVDEGSGATGNHNNFDGRLEIDRAAGNPTTTSCYGGTTITGNDLTTVNLYEGATLQAMDGRSPTITNANFHRGFILRDPNGQFTWTNGIDFQGCQPSDGTFDVRRHQTWTPSSI